GRATQGYSCNAEVIAHYGKTSSAASGGYRVHRYVDAAGHECAYYDTTLLFPVAAAQPTTDLTGVYVLDMSNPRVPVRTDNLLTPAMESPHESFSINQKRGLLAAVMAYPTFQPGVVDVYDISADCRHPVLQSSTPLGLLGHEGEFSPDGNTYWATSLFTSTITAVDVSDPVVPKLLLSTQNWTIHGLNISDDGTRFYGADTGSDPSVSGTDGTNGLTVLDISDIQNRVENPQIRLVSHLTWSTVSTPQTAIPVTITASDPPGTKATVHKYLVEVDEYGSGNKVGAGRMINIDDEKNPYVVSNMRLQVHTPEAQAGDEKSDPGEGGTGLQGYRAHYCGVPQRAEPGIVACSFIVSGLRVFDIRDPYKPVEIAYMNIAPAATKTGQGGPYAMSQPSFVPERGEIWYSDGNSGFYNVHLTHGVWPFETSHGKPLKG
ncbi:MAG: hypothetical protein V7636_1452, partial [Actinomycetota bacterium]